MSRHGQIMALLKRQPEDVLKKTLEGLKAADSVGLWSGAQIIAEAQVYAFEQTGLLDKKSADHWRKLFESQPVPKRRRSARRRKGG